MSLVNQALQKVQVQQAEREALANGQGAYYVSPRRGGLLGWKVIVGGVVLLGGGVAAAWVGGVNLKFGQGAVGGLVPSVVSVKVAESWPVIESREESRVAEAVKLQAATVAAVVEKEVPFISIPPKPEAPLEAGPVVAHATGAATQLSAPAVERKAVEAGLAVAVTEAAPVVVAAARLEPVVVKGPGLVNAQTLDVPGSGKLKLTAISHSDESSCAVINDAVVEVGDEVGTATVVSIDGKRVQVKVDQKTFTLRMP